MSFFLPTFYKIFYESQNDFNHWYNNFYTNYKETQKLIESFKEEINAALVRVKNRNIKFLDKDSEVSDIYRQDEKRIQYLIKVYYKLYDLVQLNNSDKNNKSLQYAKDILIKVIKSLINNVKEIFHLNLCTPYKWNNKPIDINNLTVQSFFDDNYFAFNHYFGYNNLTKTV